MKILAKTDIGPYRESNQDAFDAGVFETGDTWAVVCDGMGGVSGGQVASSLCVEKTVAAIKRGYRSNMSIKAVQNLLNSAICAANSSVFEESQRDRELSGMGTTIVAAIVMKDVAVIAHVGDSRAYVIKDDITCITKDHSLVQIMVDTGKITEDEAKSHPDRNIITRAVGIMSFVDVDFDVVDIDEKCQLLLCTDGLNGSVEDEEILGVVKESGDYSAEKLVETAIAKGSRDNITTVLLAAEVRGE